MVVFKLVMLTLLAVACATVAVTLVMMLVYRTPTEKELAEENRRLRRELEKLKKEKES